MNLTTRIFTGLLLMILIININPLNIDDQIIYKASGSSGGNSTSNDSIVINYIQSIANTTFSISNFNASELIENISLKNNIYINLNNNSYKLYLIETNFIADNLSSDISNIHTYHGKVINSNPSYNSFVVFTICNESICGSIEFNNTRYDITPIWLLNNSISKGYHAITGHSYNQTPIILSNGTCSNPFDIVINNTQPDTYQIEDAFNLSIGNFSDYV